MLEIMEGQRGRGGGREKKHERSREGWFGYWWADVRKGYRLVDWHPLTHLLFIEQGDEEDGSRKTAWSGAVRNPNEATLTRLLL